MALLAFASFDALAQQQFTGAAAAQLCPGSQKILINKQSHVASFISFGNESRIASATIFEKLRPVLAIQSDDSWKLIRADKDEMGMTHERYQQYYKNVKVKNGIYLVHSRNGNVVSANGMWLDGLNMSAAPALTEKQSLDKALATINAVHYRWQLAEEEALLKRRTNDPTATWYPKGELVIVSENGSAFNRNMHLAWKFDVFASQPLSRDFIYVDAQTGAILYKQTRIHDVDVAATGNTMYSGTQSFTCDNYGTNQYRLRETARGLGVETYNLNGGTNYGNATDFTNNSTNWTSTTNDDNAAYDAHWGAEKTYDYYVSQHNRNGIDNAGMAMLSYVHYSSNYNNAFWDGTEMTYGDGSQTSGGFNPLVAIDVCGHEFTHGVDEHTANLDYQDESGALNESFSDVFGTAIEFYAKPSSADFLMGEEITVTPNTALRSMQNPNLYGDPDCYTGTNWYTGTGDNGGVHTNSGVQNFWFYLLCQGGSGTNDLGNTYSVTGIGVTDAARIAYRSLSMYLVNTSQYADARTYSIQAAEDLFGPCSPEVTATANAWYACGVGSVYSPTVNAAFAADVTSSCSVPVTINFTNNSSNASNATWYFGDNTTSTTYNPSHTYAASGTYNVKLVVSSVCGTDSVLQSSYITINAPATPAVTGASSCTSPASMTLTATGTGTLNWYTQASGGTPVATGTSYTTPSISTTTTYYVESQVAQAPGNVGPASYNFGTGGQHNNTSTQYLTFDVLQPCTLATAVVNAGAAGNRTFTLWDSQGNQLNQYTVNSIPSGVSTITLNIPLTPGSYRIGGTQMNLYRNNSGANYPYTLSNAVTITGSSAGSAYYYYLYNWTINLAPCTGPRVPVNATIGLANVALDLSAVDTVCFNATAPFTLTGGSPAGGTYSGNGVSGGVFDPTAAGPGAQTITYTYTDINGCSGTATQTILVDVCTGVQGYSDINTMNIYPNPNDGNFMLDVQLGKALPNVDVRAFDLLGQSVLDTRYDLAAGTTHIAVDASKWAKGVYLLQVRTEQGVMTKRVVVR